MVMIGATQKAGSNGALAHAKSMENWLTEVLGQWRRDLVTKSI